MKPNILIKVLALTLGCLALAFSWPRDQSVAIRAHAGPKFVFTPTDDPYVFKAAVNGVAYVSLLGNCADQAELEVRFPASSGQPILVTGAGTFTSSDGTTSLSFTITGSVAPEAANPAFFNGEYCLTFTGGSGALASAKGAAEIKEVILMDSPLTGSASWVLQGHVKTRR